MMPLFPLGAVLYPGMLLPLHIFEERYRQLVRNLLARPEPRRFGVIAIRKGRETGIDGVHRSTRSAAPRPCAGSTSSTTAGSTWSPWARTVPLRTLDQTLPYPQSEIELLAEDVVDQAAAAPVVRALQVAFRTYLDSLTQRGGATEKIEDLPSDPVLLSFVVAATMVIDLPERQALLDSSRKVSGRSRSSRPAGALKMPRERDRRRRRR